MCRETMQDKRKGQEQRRPSKNNCITSNPCSRPTFIMSLHRFGTMHMTSTAFCGWEKAESKVKCLFQLHLQSRFHPPDVNPHPRPDPMLVGVCRGYSRTTRYL